MHRLLPLLLLVSTLGCRESLEIVVPDRLAAGGGDTTLVARPQLDVVIRMTRDSTGFDGNDLILLTVNDEDESLALVTGGNWSVYTIPAPGFDTFDVLLQRPRGERLDTGSFITEPYTGPTIASVAPNTAPIGSSVTMTGTGFDGGIARVWFGGREGTVTSASATEIVATVPDDALPGLVWVVIGDDAAEGIVGFQPLDEFGDEIPFLGTRHIDAIFPASGPREGVIRVYGRNFDNNFRAFFNGKNPERIFNIQTVDVEPIGSTLVAFAIPNRATDGGTVNFKLEINQVATNILPFVVVD
ncbi:MAG: IPT/TIG domain-containing protein [Planctomycetota bacterium]